MSLDWARIRAICFDVDGTLSDTDNHMVASFINSMRGLGWLISDSSLKRMARWIVMAVESPGNFLYHFGDHLGIDKAAFILSEWLNRHVPRRKPAQFWIIPGVKKMLHLLASRYPLAVVSTRSNSGTRAFLKQFKLTSLFRVVATSQTCKHTKPFPDPVLWAATQLGVAPEHCLMVGDTVVDIRAGRAAGAQTAGVLCGFGTRNELERAGADIIMKTTSDLILQMKSHDFPEKDIMP